MHMRHDGWAELMDDEEHGGCLVPMMMLFHEEDEDPEMRPEPISPEKREEVIAHMAAGLVQAYRYFRARREARVDGQGAQGGSAVGDAAAEGVLVGIFQRRNTQFS
jgi:hypothetical protein